MREIEDITKVERCKNSVVCVQVVLMRELVLK